MNSHVVFVARWREVEGEDETELAPGEIEV